MIQHNYRLAQYKESFQRMQHPFNTLPLAVKKGVYAGGFGGTSDYFVGEIRQYTGAKQEVEAFYQEQSSGNPLLGNVELIFVVAGKPLDDLLPYEVRDISAWEIPSPDLKDDLYLVFFMETGDAGLDIRCD